MRRVKIKFSPLHSSLVNLPLSIYGPLVSASVRPQVVAVHLSNLKKGDELRTAFVGWTGLAAASSTARWTSKTQDEGLDYLEIDPQLCQSLGFVEDEIVELGLIHNLPVAKSVGTEPISSDDWEILELHAQYVEDNLLSQVRVVAKDQQINVWVMGKTLIRFRVSSLDPSGSPCLLSTSTEVVIAPKLRSKPSTSQNAVATNAQLPPVIARVLPASDTSPDSTDNAASPLTILASQSTLKSLGVKDGQSVYMQRLLPPIGGLLKDIKHLETPSAQPDSKQLALNKLKEHSSKNTESEGTITEMHESYSIREIEYLPEGHIALLNHPDVRRWDRVRLSTKPFEVAELPQDLVGNRLFHMSVAQKSADLAAVNSLIEECTQFYEHGFMAGRAVDTIYNTSPKLLLCGGKGQGKTSITSVVASALEKDANLRLCPLYIDMKTFAEESLGGIRSLLQVVVRLAIWHGPAVIILDNLHQFSGVETEHTDSFKSTQVAELFLNFLDELSRHSVGVLATTESISALHKRISSGHAFSKIITIRSPDRNARSQILKHVVEKLVAKSNIDTDSLNYAALASKTEGYSPQDLHDLTNRALHKATVRATSEAETKVILGMIDYEGAQEGFTPLSVRDVKLQRSDVEWADIGGLQETRRILRETLEWPTKYAAIFAKCPLRLRSGLLLYGYPGCGKTLLASAVSKECGLNFIGVKGPELLNKYIGASEKSVRELFERASAAKPCVLFFDEFDSIAPRRGHDSTGVTDRVVNQMLTQMDGAEGLEGVYVLAATSRPDLIDPALLRPGRLDKSLLCHMPTTEERLEILAAIARKMSVEPTVDFAHFAALTEGYSGADLQALVYNAHLESVHDTFSNIATPTTQASDSSAEYILLRNSLSKAISKADVSARTSRLATILQSANSKQSKQTKVETTKPTVKTQHLQTALATTRPSVPDVERRRLDRIYQEFASDRSEALPQPPEANTWAIGNRVSLM